MFEDLPSKARTEFNNDPGTFLDFVQDPENKDKLYDLGLSEYPTTMVDTLPEKKPVEPTVEASET